MKYTFNKTGKTTEENRIYRAGLSETGRHFEDIYENHGKKKDNLRYIKNREDYKKIDI